MKKKLKLFLLLLYPITHGLFAQCPNSFSNWEEVTRINYDGNWLLSENGTSYSNTPHPTRTILNSNIVDDGFGLNDYNTDTNFNYLPLALENSPVIRVGKKFNQTGQGELSPIRRANVVSFTFTPTESNCKIRVHYIGMLQELSNDPFYYRGGSGESTNGSIQRFRRIINNPAPSTAARNAASFGLLCRYEYQSNTANLNNLLQAGGTLSRAGRTEFGMSIPNAQFNSFTSPNQNTEYGLNDMFSFAKAGTEIKTLPNTGTLNKKMNDWDSYIMDFSEFIGASVTITLFGTTSNYPGITQNHSYSYFQFECLNEGQTPLPNSTLIDIEDLDFGGCLPALPLPIDLNITDTVPTLMGSENYSSTVQQINNGIIHRWLHLPDVSARRYHNHFASLRVQFQNSSGIWNNFNQINDIGTAENLSENSPDLRILSLPNEPTSIDANGIRTYTFRVFYSTRNNPTVQTDVFSIHFGLASDSELVGTTCETPSTGNLIAEINGVNTALTQTTICRTNPNASLPTINLLLGASTCPNASYVWQRRYNLNSESSWSNINNSNNINLVNAQLQATASQCVTQLRRVTITETILCGQTIEVRTPSTEMFTIYNTGYLYSNGNSSVSIYDQDTNSTNLISNISLNLSNNIMVCYGNTVNINSNLTLGGFCDLPITENAEVSVQFLVNGFPALENPIVVSIEGNNSITDTFSFSFDALNNPSLGINVFGASGATSVPVRAVITSNRNGCISTRTRDILTLQLFPRAIGGEILLESTCPNEISNNSEVLTMTYAADPGLGYVWEYCTDYDNSGGTLTCNDTWLTIPNQFQLDLPLAALAVNGINQPIIVRRVAQSGNNCGGAQFSNSVELDFPQETPNFNLPSYFCEGQIIAAMPQATPVVEGTWHLITSNNQGNTFVTTPTLSLNENLTPGMHGYVFIPASSPTNCYAPVVWNFDVITPDPGTLSGETTIQTNSTSLITASLSGGSWSSSEPSIATVDSNGLVTGVSSGSVDIMYTITDPCEASVSITITVANCLETTVWNGTTWSNGTPNTPAFLDVAVVFNANFSTTEDLYACSITVTNNAEVTVKHVGDQNLSDDGHTITVRHEVVVIEPATFEFEDDTALVQIEDDANSGNIKYTRRTPRIVKLDYVYWSSPVAGQNLLQLSSETPQNRFYFWNPAINNWAGASPATTTMVAGKGYIIRGPEFGFNVLTNFTGIFTGVPHNGTITTPVVNSASHYNLIGNPYPSALDIDCFLSDPDNAHLDGFIRLWSHNIPIDFSGTTPGGWAYNYNVNSYVTYNRLGGVGSGITAIDMVDENGIPRFIYETDRPKGKVAAGQSFIVKANSSGNASFKNSMRVGNQNQENSQFYRGAHLPPAESSSCITEERHRLWLQIRNVTTVNGNPEQFKQCLMGYADNATTSGSLDRDYDAEIYDTTHPTTVNIYTLNPNQVPLMIQGRALSDPFDVADIIPIGFSCNYLGTSGSNTIHIGASDFDGLFADQDIYLRESLSGGGYAYHDIKNAPHIFTITETITANTTRFALVFSTTAPKAPMLNAAAFSVQASPNPFTTGIQFELINPGDTPVHLHIYDLLGKLVEEGTFTVPELQTGLFGKHLASGVYQAVITQGNQKDVQKIIKQ